MCYVLEICDSKLMNVKLCCQKKSNSLPFFFLPRDTEQLAAYHICIWVLKILNRWLFLMRTTACRKHYGPEKDLFWTQQFTTGTIRAIGTSFSKTTAQWIGLFFFIRSVEELNLPFLYILIIPLYFKCYFIFTKGKALWAMFITLRN